MSSPVLEFSTCEAGFSASAIPVWVLECESLEMVWANDAALSFWRADDRSELFARKLLGDAPARILDAAEVLRQRIRANEHFQHEWTYYPKGQAITAYVDIRAMLLPDGTLAALVQAQSLMDTVPANVQRTMAMSRHSATVTALVNAEGRLLTRNGSADASFDDIEHWREWFEDPDEADALLAATLGGDLQVVNTHARVRVDDGLRWHAIEAHVLRDPVTAELSLLVEHRDETERVEAEALATTRGEDLARLQSALTLVETQRQEILALSAPILDVGDATLAVALTGNFGAEQSELLTAALLEAVSSRGTRRVILDLTGLARIELELARRIESIVRCLELLGARPVITGIRPELARALVDAEITLEGIPTLRSLADGLRR